MLIRQKQGDTIVKEMTGQKFSFKRSKQVVTMSDKSDMKVLGEGIHIDTQLLFQRLTTAADRCVDDVSEVFKYELSSIPSSLFDNAGLPREPQKATLADALWKQGECASTSLTEDRCCSVFNGSKITHLGGFARAILTTCVDTMETTLYQ